MYGIETQLSGDAPVNYTGQSMYALMRAFGIGAKDDCFVSVMFEIDGGLRWFSALLLP